MSGVAVVTTLLKNYTALTALVPAANIEPGDIVEGVRPAISVSQIASVPNKVNIGATADSHEDRVEIKVVVARTDSISGGSGYPGMVAILKKLPAAVSNRYGTVAGVLVKSIELLPEGPDVHDPILKILSRTRDCIVRWS